MFLHHFFSPVPFVEAGFHYLRGANSALNKLRLSKNTTETAVTPRARTRERQVYTAGCRAHTKRMFDVAKGIRSSSQAANSNLLSGGTTREGENMPAGES